MSHTDEEFENLQDLNTLYHSEILDDNEMIGLGIEALTKVVNYIDNTSNHTVPVDTQYQVKQTLMYMKGRKQSTDQYRKAGDPKARTFAQYDRP